MKKLKKILCLLGLLILVLHHTYASDVTQDTCRPNFSDIYEFEVGDVFQFRQVYSSSAGGDNPTKEILTQYTIIEKDSYDNTIEYTVSGWRQSYQYSNNAQEELLLDDTSSTELFDTLITYTDSTDHILNICPNTVTPIYASGISELGYGTIYTTVILDKNDSLFTKTVGGKDNIFKVEADTLSPVSEISYKAVYQQGMGLTSMKLSFFENKESIVLEGFLRDTDTTGTIYEARNPNQEIPETTSLQNQSKDKLIQFFPNPAKDILQIKSEDEITYINVFTLSGQNILTVNKPGKTINISTIQPGIYLIKANTKGTSKAYLNRIIIY